MRIKIIILQILQILELIIGLSNFKKNFIPKLTYKLFNFFLFFKLTFNYFLNLKFFFKIF